MVLCARGGVFPGFQSVDGSVTHLLLYWNTRCSSAMLLTSECFGVERDYYHIVEAQLIVSYPVMKHILFLDVIVS